MPVYEYKCDECGCERDTILPFSEADKGMDCECGQAMRRKFSLAHLVIKLYPKDKICDTLNRENVLEKKTNDSLRSKRSQDALYSGMDYVRPLEDKIFAGFG